jgi:hypothetical protein
MRLLLRIPKELDILDGLKANAMVGIPGNRSISMNGMHIHRIMLEPRLVGLVQQGPGRRTIGGFLDLKVGQGYNVHGY